MKRLLILLILLGASPAYATRYWADPAGNNSAVCTDIDGAGDPASYGTLARAVACATASGDEVYVKPGTYTSNMYIRNPASGITIRGSDSTYANWPLIQPAAVYSSDNTWDIIKFNAVVRSNFTMRYLKFSFDSASGASSARNVFAVTGGTTLTGLTIEDFYMLGPPEGVESTSAIRVSSLTTQATIRRGTITRFNAGTVGSHCFYWAGSDSLIEHIDCSTFNGYGIQFYNGDTALIQNNIFRNNRISNATSRGGIYTQTQSVNNSIYNNIIHDWGNTNWAVQILGTNERIFNNTMYDTGSGAKGIRMRCAANCEIANNIILTPSGTAIDGTDPDITLTTNRTSGTATDIWVDPANGNFSLKESSAAIDAGTVIAAAGTWPGHSGRYVGAGVDQGAFEAPIRSTAIADNTNEWVITMSMPAQSTRDGTGLQACDHTDFTMREDTAARTESACTVIATNQVKITITEALTGGTTLDDSYTRPVSGPLTDNLCIGDPNTQCYNAEIRTWSQQSATNNVSGSPGVTWTVVGWRCLSYYADTTPATTDWLRAENAAPTTLPCMIKAGGKALVVLSLRASGANPDATTFEWMGNYDGGAYADLTNTASSTALGFLGSNPPNMTDLSTFTCLLSVSTPCAAGVVITQQASQPSVDAAENDEFEVILAVKSDSATTVGKQLCIKAALVGSDETSVTQATPPCFQIATAGSGF